MSNTTHDTYAIRGGGRGVHIAGADTAGAITGIQTGVVQYATMFFGPWGGVVALVGSAAISSASAAGILR